VSGGALVIDGLAAGYGDSQVLWDVSFEAGSGEIVAIIGSNGAGKSTLLGAISGLVDVWGGRITYDGTDLTGLPADRIVGAGSCRCRKVAGCSAR